jgi:uncharacterized protein
MKYWTLGVMALSISMISCAQKQKAKAAAPNMGVDAGNGPGNTLLWKISGNGLSKPSYLFGTIHLLCAEDAELSDNMKKVISDADEVYFEVDMDNLFDMFGAMSKMKMKGDTTLRDLLNEEDYEKVKTFFEENSSQLPFSMLEKFKPILAASLLQSGELPCEKTAVMETVIMGEAKKNNKKIKGLETMAFQAGILDSIPYKLQAEQLLKYVTDANETSESGESEMTEMWKAYNEQDLRKLEELLIKSDMGINNYTDLLLYRRNHNWVTKLKTLLPDRTLLVAVGAGHLPGEQGVINLLRKEGYTVTPVENKKIKSREI